MGGTPGKELSPVEVELRALQSWMDGWMEDFRLLRQEPCLASLLVSDAGRFSSFDTDPRLKGRMGKWYPPQQWKQNNAQTQSSVVWERH